MKSLTFLEFVSGILFILRGVVWEEARRSPSFHAAIRNNPGAALRTLGIEVPETLRLEAGILSTENHPADQISMPPNRPISDSEAAILRLAPHDPKQLNLALQILSDSLAG